MYVSNKYFNQMDLFRRWQVHKHVCLNGFIVTNTIVKLVQPVLLHTAAPAEDSLPPLHRILFRLPWPSFYGNRWVEIFPSCFIMFCLLAPLFFLELKIQIRFRGSNLLFMMVILGKQLEGSLFQFIKLTT